MKRALGVGLVLVGVVLIGLGLLFLVGSAGQASRIAVAAAGLGLGAVALGFGLRSYKAAVAASPEQVRAEILALARQQSGEITAAEVVARLGADRAATAQAVLEEMVRGGVCRRQMKGDLSTFVFVQLQPRLYVRRCEYCQAEVSISEDASECPRCGGTFRTQSESRSVADRDVYSMDDS